MKANPYFAYLLVLSGALALCPAPAAAQDAASVAHRLVVRSGLSVQLRSIPKGFTEQVDEMRGKAPDALVAAMAEAGKEAFRAEALQEEIEKILAGTLKVPEMQKAIAWLETETGRRVTLAEELASATMDEASMKAYQSRLKDKPPSAARKTLLQEILTVTNSVETAVNIVEATALGVAIGVDSMQPVQKRAGVALLRAQLQKAMPRDKLKAAMQEVLPAMTSYTYRDVSDADLTGYTAFLRGADGKRYNDAMMEALSQALVGASVRMGQLMEQAGSKRPV
jgi:hypothetical protein